MREALDSRAQLPRHQGPALRDGDGRDPHRRAGTAGPAAADQRVRDGAADPARGGGREPGMDRLLKSNTAKTRTHSLFRQGCMFYELIPNMPQHRLLPLMQRFAEMMVSSGLFGRSLRVANEGTGDVDHYSYPHYPR